MAGHFRHSFDLSNTPQIQTLISELGFEGYGLYMALMEMCAKLAYESEQDEVVFHIERLRKLWGKRALTCQKLLTKMALSCDFVVTFSGDLVLFRDVKLLEIVGKYPSKRKEKETKEKKTPLNPPVGDDSLLDSGTKPQRQKPDPAIGEAIWQAIGDHGASDREKYRLAEKQLGPFAWEIVERKGGWKRVCQSTEFQRAGFIASCRAISWEIFREWGGLSPPIKKQLPGQEIGQDHRAQCDQDRQQGSDSYGLSKAVEWSVGIHPCPEHDHTNSNACEGPTVKNFQPVDGVNQTAPPPA